MPWQALQAVFRDACVDFPGSIAPCLTKRRLMRSKRTVINTATLASPAANPHHNTGRLTWVDLIVVYLLCRRRAGLPFAAKLVTWVSFS